MYSTTNINYHGRIANRNDAYFPVDFGDSKAVMKHFEEHKGRGKYGEPICPQDVYNAVILFLHNMPFTLEDYDTVYRWLYCGCVESNANPRYNGDDYETDRTYYKEAVQHYVREVFA